jgi:peptide/nickel transport system substrate-binding protein
MRMRILMAGVVGASLAASAAFATELNVGAQNMSPYLDPGKDHSNVGSQFYYNAFDTLIGKDPAAEENVFEPALAVSWTKISPQLVEFKLRQGVRFHNGDPMTADDIVFALSRMFNPTYPPYVVRQKDRLDNFARAEKVDEETIRIYTKRPEPLWETLVSMQQMMIVPKKYLMALTGNPEVDEIEDYDAFGLAPVGTGPYRIAEFIPGERVVYERFADFWGDAAPFDKVTVRLIPEMASRITALKNGEVDIITNIPPDQVATIEADSNLKVEGMVTPLFHVVIFNTQNGIMKDPKIRQALSLAIDRDTLNEALWLGKAVVPSTHTYPQYGELYTPDLKTFEYDPERAKQLLQEAGYDGTEIRYDTQAAYYTNGLLAAQAIQEMWAAVGVTMKINVIESWTGNDPTMMSRNWSNPMYFADPFGSFGVMWAPNGPAESEGRFKTTPEYAEAWSRFRYSDTVDARKAAYAEIMQRIKDDPPVLVLYQPYESWGMNRRISWKPQPGHIPYVLDFRAGRISVATN